MATSPERSVADDFPPERIAWLTVGMLSFFYLLSMLDRFFITLLQSAIKADLGISDFQLSLLYGIAFAAIYAIAGLGFGWAVDRFSRRRIVFWSVASWSVAAAACGLAGNFATLTAARAGVGAGEAGVTPAAGSILADMFRPDRLALPSSIYALGAKVGQALSFLIGGLVTLAIIPTATYEVLGIWTLRGWQAAFLVVGLPGLALAFLIFLVPEPPRRAVVRRDGATFRDYWRFMARHRRFFVGLHLAAMMIPVASIGMISWAPAYFERVHGLTPAATGAWVGTALLVGPLVGLPLHGRITDLLHRRGRVDAHLIYLMACAILATPMGIAAFLVANLHVAAACMAVFAMLISGYLSLPGVALQLVIPGEFRGKAAAILLLVAGQGGIIVGPTSIAVLTDFAFRDTMMVGTSIAIVIAAALPLAAILLFVTARAAWPVHRARADAVESPQTS